MPLFLSEEEFLRCSHDVTLVAQKADAFIQDLYLQLETVKAESDAATITAEQTCTIIEQKYVSLSEEHSLLQSQHSELNTSLQQQTSEVAKLLAEKQELLAKLAERNWEIERHIRDAEEMSRSKRQLLEILEKRDAEISEKDATINTLNEKLVSLTDSVASKQRCLADAESELARVRAKASSYLQGKELVERHNISLNEDLKAKTDRLIQVRKESEELEADLSSRLADVERKHKQSSDSLTYHKDRVRELEAKLTSIEEDLFSTKSAATLTEERYSTEIATLTKLVELYKESSEEWSKKAGELEGVIKALETHLNQIEKEYKDKLEAEELSRKDTEKRCAELKEKLQTTTSELESLKKDNELPLSNFMTNSWGSTSEASETTEDDRAIVPRIPGGVSGTALAASLLRDGWSLAKMYNKYQEAVDALKHEQLGRKQTQAVLERVFYEIEEKTGAIIEEREEHERLVEAYSVLNQKLQHSLSEHSAYETTIRGLKASLKRQERDYDIAQKEIVDLQKQVAVLLKECRDIQLRGGSSVTSIDEESDPSSFTLAISDAENLISERLLTFRDINGLVEQNVQLRSLVRNLTHQIEENETDLKEKYEEELRKLTEETETKINAVLLRSEEQGNMIESLHNSVAMYKKLYEEEHQLRSSYTPSQASAHEQGSREIVLFRETSHETSAKTLAKMQDRVKMLEEDLAKSRSEVITLRAERDKLSFEAQSAEERLSRFMKDFEHQREEHQAVLTRNVEFSQLIVDYQKKLRDFSESVNASEELSRKLTVEVSVLKHEKEILQNSEKRASDEVRSLSERLHRLQATMDTIQSTEIVREEARSTERRKEEEHIKRIEGELAEMKKQLQEEWNNVRRLTVEHQTTLTNALEKTEELGRERAIVLQSLAVAESRAAVAENRCSSMEEILKSERAKDSGGADGGLPSSSGQVSPDIQAEIEKLSAEAQANKDHMLQYKSIAEANEAALKQMELTLESLKTEANQVRGSLEAEVRSLKERINSIETEYTLKMDEATAENAAKEEALAKVTSEMTSLKDDCSVKMLQIEGMEAQISAAKQDLEEEHQRWKAAQNNYQRQVILQSETIQELTRTSQALAESQEEISKLRRDGDMLRAENSELKSKLDAEKLTAEVYKSELDKKYNEVDELNKILHSRLEAMHIRLADKEFGKASGSSSQTVGDDDGLQNVVNYLRRTKDIAETEISLLKQEKLRLQSQLESASKSADDAQALLRSVREKSRASLHNEEEFKSLQLQLRELNLLRESNAQLREESRHNFEECQKLREILQKERTETENMEKLLADRDIELENRRREIDHLKAEKLNYEKRINELMDKCKTVDVDDYNRLKDGFQQLQDSLREKDLQLEDVKKLLSERQAAISVLERDLSRCRTELNERETRINAILQTEASLKSEVDKCKRNNNSLRRRADTLSKEKEELNKQLEDAKQVKSNVEDSVSEQSNKEKDTRIQMLEKTIEKQREKHRENLEKVNQEKMLLSDELKKNLEKVNQEKLLLSEELKKNLEKFNQEKLLLSEELKKNQQVLKLVQDDVEKLKNLGGSQPETTPVASTLPEDLGFAHSSAVENVVPATTPSEPDPAAPANSTYPDGATVGQSGAPSTTTPAATPANAPPARASEDRDRRPVTRANIKTGRRLVRPSLSKPKETQGDVDMSEADESNAGTSSLDNQGLGNPSLPTKSTVNKRSADEILSPEEASLDLATPAQKKPKSSECVQDSGEESSAVPVKLSDVLNDDTIDEKGNTEEPGKEESDDAERDDSEAPGEEMDEPTPTEQNEDVEIADEKSDKPSEAIHSDDQLRYQTEQDVQRIVTESEEREEGELDTELTDTDGDGIVQEVGEFLRDESVEPPRSPSIEPPRSPSIEAQITETLEAGEIDPSDLEEEKNDSSNTDKIIDSLGKPHDGVGSIVEPPSVVGSSSSAVEASGSTADVEALEEADSIVKPPSPVNTIVNFAERARQRALQNATRIIPTRGRTGPVVRGRSGPGARGRPPNVRGRGVLRGRGRPPRGQSPG